MSESGKKKPRQILGPNAIRAAKLAKNIHKSELSEPNVSNTNSTTPFLKSILKANKDSTHQSYPVFNSNFDKLNLQEMASYWPYAGQFLSPMCPPAGYSLLSATPYPLPIYSTGNPGGVFEQSQMRGQHSSSPITNPGRNEGNANMCIQIGVQCFNQNSAINLSSVNDLPNSMAKTNVTTTASSNPDQVDIIQNIVHNNDLPNDDSSATNLSSNSSSSYGEKELDKKFCNRFSFEFCDSKNTDALNSIIGNTTVNASVKREDQIKLDPKKLSDLTSLGMRGSETAERVAHTHRNRPCFKKIDSLCARMKQDLIRPDGVLPNINSQGIAWAVKDLIFIFTRVMSAWIIAKGYVYNTPEGLNKIKSALSPGFLRSFAAWQETTEDFVDNLIESFVNLDDLISQNQKTPTKMETKQSSTPVKTTNTSDYPNLFDESLDFLNLSADFPTNAIPKEIATTANSKSYYSTLVEDSEESQRKATENGTYMKTGVYNPILKDSISDLDPIYFNKKEIIESPPPFDSQKNDLTNNNQNNCSELGWTTNPTTVLEWRDNLSKLSNNGDGDAKIKYNDGEQEKIELNTNCWDYDFKVLEKNSSKSIFDASQIISSDNVDRLEYLMNKMRTLSIGNLFFSKQFMRNYFSDFSEKFPNLMDLRSIFLKAQIGSYRDCNEFVHDLKLIIYYGRLYLKNKKDELLESSINKYEDDLNKILKDDIFSDCLFEIKTNSAPNDLI